MPVYSDFLFLLFLLQFERDAGNFANGIAAVIWRTLLSQDFVYSPLTTPFFDLLTAADGKDMSLELLVGQVRRAES